MNQLQTLTGEDFARKAMETPAQKAVDELQRDWAKKKQIECPLDHSFKDGFYLRTVHVPAGTVVISKIFKADFPFFISKGQVSVWVERMGIKHIEAPFWGFTNAGARRIIMHHTDVDWTTVHYVGNKTDVAEIEKDIIYTPSEDQMDVEIESEIINMLKEKK
jgi:hypothetical protein